MENQVPYAVPPVPQPAPQMPGAAPVASPVDRAYLLPPLNPMVFMVTMAWRLVIVVFGIWGIQDIFSLAPGFEEVLDIFLYFTTLSMALVTLVWTVGLLRPLVMWGVPLRHKLEGPYGWFRGLVACASILTGIVFIFIMHGPLESPRSFIPHLILPIAVLIDWLAFGRNQTRLPWWVPLTWALTLAPYLLAYVWDANEDGQPMYGFLDPESEDWWLWVAGFVAGFLVLAYVVWGLGRLRGLFGTAPQGAQSHMRAVPANGQWAPPGPGGPAPWPAPQAPAGNVGQPVPFAAGQQPTVPQGSQPWPNGAPGASVQPWQGGGQPRGPQQWPGSPQGWGDSQSY